MSSPVVFNYTAWEARYPEFSAVMEATAQGYFNEATLYWDNTGCSPVTDPANQLTILNMLTAHIAALYGPQGGAGTGDPGAPVGRISNATEGSVSVALQNDYAPGTVQWYQQTKYGSSFWAATAQYRTARYVRGALQPGGLAPFTMPIFGQPYLNS